MQNPALPDHSLSMSQQQGWSRYAGLGLAAVLNIGLIAALASGLGVKIGTYTPPILKMRVIEPQTNKPQVIPPPNPTMERVPKVAQVPVPIIQVAPDAMQQTLQVQPEQQQQQQLPAQAADAAASGLTNTHTTPPYPPTAFRLGQQGTTVLAITVAADGAVSDAQIVASSGFPELDQAAVSWVKEHWRYKPAMQGGAAVPSRTQAAVKFNLRDAH